jgi:hypothetical protein
VEVVMRTGIAIGAACAMACGCATAMGQGQVVHSFGAMPGGVFLDVNEPPNCNFPTPTITVPVAGRSVVMTTTRGSSMTSPYSLGCFNFLGFPSFTDQPDQAVNPGNFRGHLSTPSDGYGDLILDFSEPLTAFGITSLLDGLFNTNAGDTVIVYDGVRGSGNVLGTTSTGPAAGGRLRLGFAAIVVPTAQIRSARIVMDERFYIDGYAVAVGPPCGSADFNGDGDIGTDADIEAFFLCLGGDCCATCDPRGADFNGDGDIGTDADIESFFRVLGGGPC